MSDDKEKNYTTMRISNNVKDKLEDMKLDNEGLSVVIARLIEENKQLRNDKDILNRIVSQTSNSIAFPNNVHRATFVIVKCVYDVGLSEEDKFNDLKRYLSSMLSTDSSSVKISISNLKEIIRSDGGEVPQALIRFEKYVDEIY